MKNEDQQDSDEEHHETIAASRGSKARPRIPPHRGWCGGGSGAVWCGRRDKNTSCGGGSLRVGGRCPKNSAAFLLDAARRDELGIDAYLR